MAKIAITNGINQKLTRNWSQMRRKTPRRKRLMMILFDAIVCPTFSNHPSTFLPTLDYHFPSLIPVKFTTKLKTLMSSPLPKSTVEKNWSSYLLSRSLTTPANYRKVILTIASTQW